MSSLTKAFIERLYCYDVFDESDRSIWLSPGDLWGMKYAVTVSVCEQNKAEDMGFTSQAMDRSLQSVGYRIVESVKALHLFDRGEAEKHRETLDEAFSAGKRLGMTLLLADRWKKRHGGD
jgi:multimeric flavodoxin WrbA